MYVLFSFGKIYKSKKLKPLKRFIFKNFGYRLDKKLRAISSGVWVEKKDGKALKKLNWFPYKKSK
jgi:hypothetical protein